MATVDDGAGTGEAASTVESATGVGAARVGFDIEIAVIVAVGDATAKEGVESC